MGWKMPDTEQSVEGKDCQASSTEQSVTGANRKARGPATRDVIGPRGHEPHLEISAAYHHKKEN